MGKKDRRASPSQSAPLSQSTMRVCIGENRHFVFYEDTVVKSDGVVTRAGQPSAKKRKRVAVMGSELWHGCILLATENGSIRVVRVDETMRDGESPSEISDGRCVEPYCTIRCREPSVIVSTENTVFVGTQRGEIHCLNEEMELMGIIGTSGGSIARLKVSKSDANVLRVRFGSGETMRIDWKGSIDSAETPENIEEFEQKYEYQESALMESEEIEHIYDYPDSAVIRVRNGEIDQNYAYPDYEWMMRNEETDQNIDYPDPPEFPVRVEQNDYPDYDWMVRACEDRENGVNVEEDMAPPVKKRRIMALRSQSTLNSDASQGTIAPSQAEANPRAMNKSDLDCPLCEYRAHVVSTFCSHLRKLHATTPSLVGVVIRCECGTDSLSAYHSNASKCAVKKFTVVGKGGGPIRVLNAVKPTPCCLLCPFYSSTIFGYAKHLCSAHQSTLTEVKHYLLCDCGMRMTSTSTKWLAKHRLYSKCDGRRFVLVPGTVDWRVEKRKEKEAKATMKYKSKDGKKKKKKQ